MLLTSINAEDHQIPAFLGKLLSKVYKVVLATIIVFSLLTGISSCSQGLIQSVQDTTQKISQSLQKVQSFQSVLVDKYQERGITVEINHSFTEKISVIHVQFTNTSFNKLTASERQKIARDVAQLAQDHFTLEKLEYSILVSFVDFRNYVVLQYSRVIDSYILHPSDLVPISSHSKKHSIAQEMDLVK